ncbi:MAG TPA: M15 family metallopeptidase [Pyrinomonadaceae bacterium]|nr:M15 family metallopeptidase [Pyrinomonadaceae bacterium]
MRSESRTLGLSLTARVFVFVFASLVFAQAARAQGQTPQTRPSPSQGPPVESGEFREPELVELVRLDKSLRLDIRYATANNFAGRPVYTQARAFLQKPAARALVRVHRGLKKKGYGLLVFDGYRPWRVTKLFWDLTPEDKRQFVADPARGSRHNRGCAVDLTLYDLRTGREVSMPTPYDDFTARAHVNYAGATPEQRAARDLLRSAMEAEGFAVYEPEWWHYDFRDWRQYRILDLSFEELGRERRKPKRDAKD